MSMEPINLNFTFTSDGVTHDATVAETSEAMKIDRNYVWSIQPILAGIVGGPPKYTIQVSSDNVTWDDYSTAATTVDANDPFDDDHLSFNWMRIKHLVNVTTDGTIKYPINLKRP